ncbi:MAG: pirin family protein [Nannocystaceae bacterium]
MSAPAIVAVAPLGPPPWPTLDPFLFCVHHLDEYPAGNEAMGPSASLEGRRIGMDFAGKDGWRMYHGDTIPGFPRHPHRGFETVTLARRGYIDHSDSMGATARFGHGDVQWMTAGKGVVHSEMFPLRERERGNTTELFQIWMNLPAADKFVEPHFTMLWAGTIPRRRELDADGRATEIVAVAGALGDSKPPSPPPASWASRPEAEVAIWTLRLEPGARWRLPAASKGLSRVLYQFRGTVKIDGREFAPSHAIQLRSDAPVEFHNGAEESELLLLQGRPIGEPVVQHGPFVMNTRAEIQQAFADYQRTGFGGWPWQSDDPVHAREEGRFAVHADGRKERPGA